MSSVRILLNPLITLFLFISLLVPGCANNQIVSNTNNPLKYSSRDNAITLMSDDKKYRVSLYSNHYPLPMGKIHSWTVKIEHADGQPVENAKIYIHGGMPAHQHDFPTRPRINKYLGDGLYRIDGVKFSMPGEWEMRINVKEATRRDRAVFKINL